MSQLVSSGDSIKIWDTATYDCDYCFESPGSHYTSNSWSCDQGCVASCSRDRSASSRAVLTYYNKKSACFSSQEIKLEGIENPSLLQFPR